MNATVDNLVNENKKLKRVVGAYKNMNKGVGITTQNRFKVLTDESEMNWNENEQNVGGSVSKLKPVAKPPPIKITDDKIKIHDVKAFMNEIQITSFQAKSISIGIKLDLHDKSDYAKCVEALSARKIAFFTHRDKSEKTFKAVLAGLPKMETSVIAEEMKQYNIVPSSVTELMTKNPNPHNCLYLVQFHAKDISLNLLRKIRAIDHVIVNWKPFKPRNKGPTQCNKCAMFGHGAQNCHRSEACMLCASVSHTTENCHYSEATKEAFVFKCFNCTLKNLPNTNHRANDPKCPCRSNYLEIRNNINHKNTVRTARTNSKSNDFSLNEESFPDLQRRSNPVECNFTHSNRPTYAEQAKRAGGSSDLYSMDELFDIFQSAVDDLSACTNKGQQLKVLMRLLNNAYQ